MQLRIGRCLISDLLDAKRMSQRDLSILSGVDERVISFYTTGRRKRMSLEIAVAIADALKVNPRDLFEWPE